MNRRDLLAGVGAVTLAAGLSPAGRALAAPGAPAQLDALFDVFVGETMDLQPEFATSLGMDSGARGWEKSKLSDRSPAGAKAQVDLAEGQLRRLDAFEAGGLPRADALNRDVVLYSLRQQVDAARRFKYAGGGAGAPYDLNQFPGSAYHSIPHFLV